MKVEGVPSASLRLVAVECNGKEDGLPCGRTRVNLMALISPVSSHFLLCRTEG